MKIRLLFCSILIFLSSSLSGVTTGLSCLRHPETGKKIVLLFDYHLFQAALRKLSGFPSLEQLMPILTPHNQEHENLIEELSSKNENTAWLSECEGQLQYHIKNGDCKDDLSTMILTPKAAYAHGKTYNERIYFMNNLALMPYDPRHPYDTWTTLSFVLEFKLYYEVYKKGTIPELNAMTINVYREHIQKRTDQCCGFIEQLTTYNEAYKNLLKENFKELSKKYLNLISEACSKYSLTPSDHVLEIYKKEFEAMNIPDYDCTKISNDTKIPYIFTYAREFGVAIFDIGCLYEVTNIPLQHSIIQTGGLHAKLLEHRLIKLGYILEQTYGNAPQYSVNEKTEYVSNPPANLIDGIMQINPVEQVDKKVLSFFAIQKKQHISSL